jgi:hypothetical protein
VKVRLHEKNGKLLELPLHHLAAEAMDAYLAAAGLLGADGLVKPESVDAWIFQLLTADDTLSGKLLTRRWAPAYDPQEFRSYRDHGT